MKNIYEKNVKVEADYVNCENYYDLLGMLAQMQNVISEHTVDLGVDYPNMLAKSNAFWVILKTKVKVFKEVKWNDWVNIKTYPLPPSLVRCDRESIITNMNGEVVAASTGEWCILDFDTKKPRRVSSSCYPEGLNYVTERAVPERAKRVVCKFAPGDLAYERKIMLTDLDFNNHTNNKSYTRFALDAFSSETFRAKAVSEYDINFENQSYEGEVLRIYVKETAPDTYIIGGEDKADGRRVFTAEMTFVPRGNLNK